MFARKEGKGRDTPYPHHANCTWLELPNQENPVSRGKQDPGCCYMLHIMHSTLSSPSALHPSQQLIVSPTVLPFSVIRPKRTSVRLKGSHDSEAKHGPRGKTSQTGKNPRWVIRRVISYRFASFKCYPLSIRYTRILLPVRESQHRGNHRLTTSTLFQLSLAGPTRELK